MTFADSLRELADLVETNPLPPQKYPLAAPTINYLVRSAEAVQECARAFGVQPEPEYMGCITAATIRVPGLELRVAHVGHVAGDE
jgi:hypothetical protein